MTGEFSVTNPSGRDFLGSHSRFGSARAEGWLPGRDPPGRSEGQKSRTLETDIFSRSDIHPRRREWLGSAFVRDPLTVAFCIYAPVLGGAEGTHAAARNSILNHSGKKGDEPMKARKGGGRGGVVRGRSSSNQWN